MKKYLLICVISLMSVFLFGCNQDINKKIMEQWDMEVDTTLQSPEEVVSNVDGDALQQESIAEQVGSEVYDEFESAKDKEYNEGMDKILNQSGDKNGNAGRDILIKYYQVYGKLRQFSPYIITVSIFFGTVIAIFSRYNKGLRRFAIYGLIIGVPVVMLMIVYGLGYLNKLFFY